LKLSAPAAVSLDMCVEQDGLGALKVCREFYEIELQCRIVPSGMRAARRIGARTAAGGVQAVLRRCFVAMELHSAVAAAAAAGCDVRAVSLTNSSTGVTKGGSRRASSAARSGVTWRGLGGTSRNRPHPPGRDARVHVGTRGSCRRS
jgi:hypothetical protein